MSGERPSLATLPPRPTSGRARATIAIAAIALVAASALTLELSLAALFEAGAARALAGFVAGFAPPTHDVPFLAGLVRAAGETLAMSLVGTALGASLALPLALCASPPRFRPPSRAPAGTPTRVPNGASGRRDVGRAGARLLLVALRSVPELVWAALLLVVVGIGPAGGTLALALHSAGALGRLHAETLESLPPASAEVLRVNGAPPLAVFLHATLPVAMPQLLSWTLYRWESNIRIAALLGIVGAGGLGQALHVSLSLFRMHDAASVILVTLALVAAVDALSFRVRRRLTR